MSVPADNSSASSDDINDVFDSIVLSEERLSEQGYKEGLQKGRSQGKTDGFHMGYHRGAQIGAELGYYTGVLRAVLTTATKNKVLPDKVFCDVKNLLQLLETFPQTNTRDEDILMLRDNIKYWSVLVPEAIQREFEHVGIERFSSAFWDLGRRDSASEPCGKASPECPSFAEFLCSARRMYVGGLSDIVLTCQQLKERLSVMAGSVGSVKSEQFMSCKKAHEVEVMSEVAAMLVCASDASHVVDVGGGKGYLSSMLALQHKLPVLGIDSSRDNTSGAARHSHKLKKAWGLFCSKEDGEEEKSETKQRGAAAAENTTTVDGYYKLVTQFVSADTRLSQLVEDHFACAANCRVCVVGLHTCGNLAPACLRTFATDERLVALCAVGCCYNLLEEDGFPVSHHLRHSGFTLGRNAKMLAAQAIDRITDKQQLAVDSLFYRALLEVLLKESCDGAAGWGHVGRLAAKCTNFREYVHKAFAKLNIGVQVSESRLEELNAQYLPQKDNLKAFLFLRVALAPVVEAALLLDRLLYLHEKGFRKSCLVQLFDPVISPRCYGIISLKN